MNWCNLRNLWMKMSHAGVYLHIPFCRSHCSYCDFATGMYEGALADRYVNALVSEIAKWSVVDSPSVVDTIYFGGGTPSLLTPSQIERILKAVHHRFEVIGGAEVTLEINPASMISASSPRSRRLSGEILVTDTHSGDAESTEIAQRKIHGEDSPELSSQKLRAFRSLG